MTGGHHMADDQYCSQYRYMYNVSVLLHQMAPNDAELHVVTPEFDRELRQRGGQLNRASELLKSGPTAEGSAYLTAETQETTHPETFVGPTGLTYRSKQVRGRFHFNIHIYLVSRLPMLLLVTPLREEGWSPALRNPKGADNVSLGLFTTCTHTPLLLFIDTLEL